MIEFSGNISNNCKKYIINRQKILTTTIVLFICIMILIPFIVLTFTNDIVFIYACICIILMPLIQYFSFNGRTLDYIIPTKITISLPYIHSEGNKFSESREITEINKIIDYGEWYRVSFKFGYKSQNFVIEKKLITLGTIEEFEEIFKEKIIRKY